MILIVDDDARIRDAAADALSAEGHPVIAAADGLEALKICRKRKDIRLIVTDVIMPGLRGPDFVAHVVADRPDLPVIYISGSIGETPPEALRGYPLLAKPFTASTLTRLVNKALAAS